MSLKNCIRAAVDGGEITLEEGQALEKRYDQIVRHVFSKGRARQQLIEELEAEAHERKRRALLTETARKRLVNTISAHRNAAGVGDQAEAFKMLHEHFGGARFEDIENKRLAILGQAHAKLDGLLHDFRKGAITGDKRRHGGRTKARLENVVKELFGEQSGDQSAKELASAVEDVFEDLRQRFNSAGGAIGKLDKYGLPQHHDAEALFNAGRDAWLQFISPLLDRDRMVSALTGHKLTDDELEEGLNLIWKRITTEGWVDREPTGQEVGKGALYNQHADHRFLHFKSADAWLRYQKSFGEGDPFAAIMGHMATMSRDIAAMEILGPNPEVMRTYLKQYIIHQAVNVRPLDRIIADLKVKFERASASDSSKADVFAEAALAITPVERALQRAKASKRPKPDRIEKLQTELDVLIARLDQASEDMTDTIDSVRVELQQARERRALFADSANTLDQVKRAIYAADNMWAVMRGSHNAPVHSRVANTLATTRNLVSAASLGSAALSAVSDVAFSKATRGFVGLPASVTGVIGETVAHFQPGTRREAVRAGLILDSATHAMHQQARYVGSVDSKAVSGYVVDRVLALSGLTPWTQAGKHAFGMAFQAEIADRVRQSFMELPKLLRETFERHGLTSQDWDEIRVAPFYEPKPGATFLRPNEIAQAAGRELAEKYLAMILRETRHAVPEGTIRSQSFMTAGRPGTFIGELSRNFAQFKSFGVAVVMLHGARIAREIGAGRRARGAAYAGSLLITGSLLGALALQLKEMAQGRDPRDMTSENFWGAAMLQGGGLGIYGDFLFSGVNRFGGGMTSTVAGPLVGKFDTLRNTTIGNLLKQADDDSKSNVGRDGVKFLRDWTPGGSLWYVRSAYERMLLDQLQHLIDPDARKAFRRKMQMQHSTYGNEYWWRPGEQAPRRGVDLRSATGK